MHVPYYLSQRYPLCPSEKCNAQPRPAAPLDVRSAIRPAAHGLHGSYLPAAHAWLREELRWH